LNPSELSRLYSLLPEDLNLKEKEKLMNSVIKGDKVGPIGVSPLESFGKMMGNSVFTKAH